MMPFFRLSHAMQWRTIPRAPPAAMPFPFAPLPFELAVHPSMIEEELVEIPAYPPFALAVQPVTAPSPLTAIPAASVSVLLLVTLSEAVQSSTRHFSPPKFRPPYSR